MFCGACSQQMNPDARFCCHCGKPLEAPQQAWNFNNFKTGRLTRPRVGRMIAGVCAGFAQHYGWDLNLVRIITALIIVLTGVGAIAYIAAWVIIPETPYALPVKST